jgi:uncharacterized tellurite resistance protein B-like protein
MIKSLQALLTHLLPPAPAAAQPAQEHVLQLATAVMLVEVMRADTTFDDTERQAVRQALCEKFGLDVHEAQALSTLAEETARQATDLFTFTRHINDHFEMPQKLRMVELMWGVAYADGRLSEHERHVMWRIADLLHVPQGAYVHARLRAQQAAGLGPAA